MARPIIVKVQIAIYTNVPGHEREILIYNRDRTRKGIVRMTPELDALLKGELKSFWYAVWKRKSRTFDIVGPAPWQEW
jgi:hypothetical protein